MLKSRQHFPPGGFQFYQPETNWTAPQHLSFQDVVSQVILHRRANPRFKLSTERAAVESEVDQYNTLRLKSIKGGDAYIAGDGPPQVFREPRRGDAQAGAAAAVKSVGVAIGTIADWLGDDLEPVPRAQAEQRASVCLRCPLNQLGNFWQRTEAKAAAALRALVNAKNELNLSTSVDAQLHSCMACDCWNPLKVHVPIAHIKANLRPEQFGALWENCWVRAEISA